VLNPFQAKLRLYQEKAVQAIFNYFRTETGNPLIVAPTGSGKSHLIASFVETTLKKYPKTLITILAHRKELLIQNSEKILNHFPACPLGIYSAGLKKRELNQVTMAGIASVYNKANLFSYQNLVLVDEAHLIPKGGMGMYKRFLDDLKRNNPKLKVIGFTATPYRLDSGMLTEGEDRLFTDIAYEIDLLQLIQEGYLSPLCSKKSLIQADLSTARIRAGEFVSQDIERIMNDDFLTEAALLEIMRYGEYRKSWIIFCAGVTHTRRVTEKLKERGITADCVTGETPPGERKQILDDFRSGKIRAILNCDVLTTGFDAPNIDLLILLRPTRSVGLYVQMCGRGSRLSPGKTDCMVLDFAGNIERFGPLDMVRIKKKKSGSGDSDAPPTKTCFKCEAVVPTAAKICPFCQHEFPEREREKHDITASDKPILSSVTERIIDATEYGSYEREGFKTFRVNYFCQEDRISQFVGFESSGQGRIRAIEWWQTHAKKGRDSNTPQTVYEALERLVELREPKTLTCRPDKRFWKVLSIEFFDENDPLANRNREEEQEMNDDFWKKFGVNI
jgi:DNA repair protein RadD